MIELLSTLLLAEVERNPDAYHADPEGGTNRDTHAAQRFRGDGAMNPSLQAKSQPPVNGNAHSPPDREAWRVEHERRRAELRRIYAGVPDLVVDDLEREAMKETERLARAGALALVVYIRRRRRKAQEPPKP